MLGPQRLEYETKTTTSEPGRTSPAGTRRRNARALGSAYYRPACDIYRSRTCSRRCPELAAIPDCSTPQHTIVPVLMLRGCPPTSMCYTSPASSQAPSALPRACGSTSSSIDSKRARPALEPEAPEDSGRPRPATCPTPLEDRAAVCLAAELPASRHPLGAPRRELPRLRPPRQHLHPASTVLRYALIQSQLNEWAAFFQRTVRLKKVSAINQIRRAELCFAYCIQDFAVQETRVIAVDDQDILVV